MDNTDNWQWLQEQQEQEQFCHEYEAWADKYDRETLLQRHVLDWADYIFAHCGGDRAICNGDQLTVAMEEGYLAEEFLESFFYKTVFKGDNNGI